jgi:hypothetical protein
MLPDNIPILLLIPESEKVKRAQCLLAKINPLDVVFQVARKVFGTTLSPSYTTVMIFWLSIVRTLCSPMCNRIWVHTVHGTALTAVHLRKFTRDYVADLFPNCTKFTLMVSQDVDFPSPLVAHCCLPSYFYSACVGISVTWPAQHAITTTSCG